MQENESPLPRVKKKTQWSPLAWVLGLSSAFFVVFLIISGAVYLVRGPSRTSESGGAKASLFGGGSVGVAELSGVIMDSKRFLKTLRRFEEDDHVKAVVIRLNSPGGAVAPSQEIYEAVRKFPKPVVASMASVAASGGYYVACGAKKIFANAGTLTGSIGVIMEFANLSKLYEWAKVKRYVLKTGRYKDAGSDTREMEPDERALLQAMIDDVLSQFKKAVSVGRKLTLEQVTKLADGRIFSGQQAKAVGLVDELGTLEDAIKDAAAMANIKGKPNVIYPSKRNKRVIDYLLEDREPSEESEEGSSRSTGWLARLLTQTLGTTVAPSWALEPGIYWLWTGAR